MTVRFKISLLIPLLFFILSGCHKSDNPVVGEDKNRTVIAYLGRDNSDLYYEWEDKKNAMAEGWSGTNGNLLIFEDLYGDGIGLYEVVRINGRNSLMALDTYGIGEDSADPEVFNSVVISLLSTYPADSYGLIVFSHGSGWLPEGSLETPRSIIKDNDSEMEITDFARALPQNYKFEFIVFEACYMAGIEVVYELRDKTDYILASSAEIISPGFRDIYAGYMDYFFLPSADLYSFTAQAFDYVNSQSGAWQSGTLSVINTAYLYELGQWLKRHIDTEKIGSIDPDEIQHFDRRSGNHLYFDFEDYFSRIIKEDADLSEFAGILEKCVTYKAATPYFFSGLFGGFEINKHSGLTTYIEQEEFPYINERYRELNWYNDVLTE
ncbi:MAG: clostripain-related cysteine peptidase [Rikenellaceae bacterium]|nr:clostripain-related cysteine peptidase [Rikenellaceae bacterium]